MDNDQILINLYKQQQVNETRSRLQKIFMIISASGSAIALVVTSLYFVSWLYVAAFASTFLCVLVNAAMVWFKRMKLTTASYLTTLYSAFVFIPAFWIMTDITGSAPYVSLIILAAILTLFADKKLKWLLVSYIAVLAGLTVYSALLNFPKTDDAISLVYLITAYSIAVETIVLYLLYKQKEFNDLNDKFLRSSFKDELTQLYNRKLLDLIIEYQESLYKRERKNYILMMFDVDDFKKMNDEHGHVYGDVILRTVAQCVHEKARSSDFVVRYGGDEFLLIQTNASFASIQAFIGRIEQAMSTSCDLETQLSISFGYAARTECESPEAVLKLADQRLYEKKQAKKVGR